MLNVNSRCYAIHTEFIALFTSEWLHGIHSQTIPLHVLFYTVDKENQIFQIDIYIILVQALKSQHGTLSI